MIEQTVGEFRRRIEIQPGFHWTRDDPSRDFGNGSVKFRFVLIGEKGAMQWVFGTHWMPEAARRDVLRRSIAHALGPRDEEDYQKPSGYDLGYHAHEPQYEGHRVCQDNCEYLGGPCFYDGSSTAADELVEGFLNGGDDWVWNRLEALYRHRFEGAEYPSLHPIIVPHPDDRKVA